MMVALPLGFGASYAQAPDNEGEAQHVVILNAVDPYLPAYIALDTALREAIRAGHKAPAELFAESLSPPKRPMSVQPISSATTSRMFGCLLETACAVHKKKKAADAKITYFHG